MRIIAGKYGGRIIESPKKHATHPMSEKIRGALFNALGDIEGLNFFDAYAGSGAIGIEALSRGAKYVLFTDKDRQAVATIKTNLNSLSLDSEYFDISEANCVSYIQNQPKQFDIIVADPPYDDVKPLQIEALSGYINKDGILILSLPPKEADVEMTGFKTIQQKAYGDATLTFMKKL